MRRQGMVVPAGGHGGWMTVVRGEVYGEEATIDVMWSGWFHRRTLGSPKPREISKRR